MSKDFKHIVEEMKGTPEDYTQSEEQLKSLLLEKDAEIDKLKAELAKKNDHLNHFVYAAAHALKSPIANLNLITILLEKSKDVDDMKHYLQSIKSSIDKMNSTIHGLVQGFQLQSLEEDPVVEINFQQFFECTLFKCLKVPVEGTPFILDFERCPSINFMKNSLKDLSVIILSNALKYSSDERKPEITISSYKTENATVLEFKDNGIGIDMEKFGKDLFVPFKKFSSLSDGNGLGLYLAKMIIENHKGTIEIESEQNVGTKVKCFLKNNP